MAEYIHNENIVKKGDPIVFKNNCEYSFDVDTGIIFHKSGIYEVSIVGNITTVSKVMDRNQGEWIPFTYTIKDDWYQDKETRYRCSLCNKSTIHNSRFCPNCGGKMKLKDDNNYTFKKYGRWNRKTNGWDGVYYECSCCKKVITPPEDTSINDLYKFYNTCPFCKADMKGE